MVNFMSTQTYNKPPSNLPIAPPRTGGDVENIPTTVVLMPSDETRHLSLLVAWGFLLLNAFVAGQLTSLTLLNNAHYGQQEQDLYFSFTVKLGVMLFAMAQMAVICTGAIAIFYRSPRFMAPFLVMQVITIAIIILLLAYVIQSIIGYCFFFLSTCEGNNNRLFAAEYFLVLTAILCEKLFEFWLFRSILQKFSRQTNSNGGSSVVSEQSIRAKNAGKVLNDTDEEDTVFDKYTVPITKPSKPRRQRSIV